MTALMAEDVISLKRPKRLKFSPPSPVSIPMDYDKQYNVARDDGQGIQSTGNTLFEACLAAKAHGPNGIVVTPEGRLVAFYCGHRNRIAPGFGAYPLEREQIINDFGYEAL